MFSLLSADPCRAEEIPRVPGTGELLIIERAVRDVPVEANAVEVDETTEVVTPEFVLRVEETTYENLISKQTDPKVLERHGRGDLPPIHLHRNYFNGVKEYQGPSLPGGLTVLAAHHPESTDRSWESLKTVRVVLPAGLPVIVYRRDSITYAYDDRRVMFRFHANEECDIHIVEKRGSGRFLQRLGGRVKGTGQRIRKRAHEVPLTESVSNNARLVRDTARGAVGIALTLASAWVDKVGQAAEALPGIKTIRSAGQKSAEGTGQIEEIRQQGIDAARQAQRFRVSRP